MTSYQTMSAQLDQQSWHQRQRSLAAWTRSANTAEVDAALAQLSGGEVFERRAAMFVAGLSGRADVLLRGLTDSSLMVRRAAVRWAAMRCDGASLLAAVPSLPPATRVALAAAVGVARRADVARALAQALLSAGDRRAARALLEWTDAATVRAAWLAGGVRAVRWRHAAQRFPALVLELLEVELKAVGLDAGAAWPWWAFSGALPTLAERQPGAVLALWEQYGPRTTWPQAFASVWPALLRAEPARVVALVVSALATSRQPLPTALLRAAKRLAPAPLRELLRAVVRDHRAFAQVLEALPPSRREACFREALEGLDASATCWSAEVLTVLPHALRHAEVRRMRALPAVRRDPAEALRLTAWLPLDEAQAALAPELRAAKGEVRAQAWSLGLAAVASNRRGLREAVASLERLRNEQDPVRLMACAALARVPPSLFTDADAPALLQLVEAVATARDTSGATRGALQQLAHRLIRAQAEAPGSALFKAALAMLLRLAEQRPVLTFPKLDNGLRRGAEVPLVAALVPWLRAEVGRELNRNVLALAAALGKRAWPLDELQALLREVAFAPSAQISTWERQDAIRRWLEPPRGRDERVRALLDHDESVVTFAPVWQHLHVHRQDWLDPFIGGRRLSGRYASEKTGWLFPAQSGFGRWLPRQQRVFARTLRTVFDDHGHHLQTRGRCVSTLAALAVVGTDELEPLTKHKEVVLAEAALGALAWLDVPAPALRVLAENLDGDRARVAAYALPRVARLIAAEEQLAVLDELLGRPKLKVTVRKEVVRLLGGLLLPGVGQRLEAEWHREGAHRDVKVALLHAARQRPEEPHSWAMLEAAASSPERELAVSLLNPPPTELAPAHRARYATLLMSLADHPQREVRHALLQRLSVAGSWADVVPALACEKAAAALLEPSPDAPWPEAARALALSGPRPEALARFDGAVTALVRGAQADAVSGAAGREDLPAQARLEAVCAALSGSGLADRARTRPGRDALCRALEPVRAWLGEEWLTLRLVDQPIGPGALDEACRGGRGHVDGPALQRAVHSWAADVSRPGTAALLLSIAAPLESAEPWAALGLVSAAAARFGWSPEVRAQLASLRKGPVAAAARRLRAP